jgi:undecaprenyl-diphosphatase
MYSYRENKNWILMIITGALGFGLILLLVLSGASDGFDHAVQQFAVGMRCGPLNAFMAKFTLLGNWQTIVFFCIILLIIKPTRIKFGIPLTVGAIFVTMLNKIIKTIVARPRPDDVIHLVEAHGYSFSSGHAITSMFFFGMAIWLVRRYVENRALKNFLTVILLIPAIGIGLSRIYCGVHYPTDVLAGWFLGFAAIGGAIGVLNDHS